MDIKLYRDMLVDARENSKGVTAATYQNALDMLDSCGFPEVKPTDDRASILCSAMSCVCGSREETYGGPKDNFERIAKMWEAYMSGTCIELGADICISPQDVAIMMALVKIARIANGEFCVDNYIDLAGYGALAGEIAADAHAEMELVYMEAIGKSGGVIHNESKHPPDGEGNASVLISPADPDPNASSITKRRRCRDRTI